MPFFQNSVTNKYLKTLDKQKISDAYAKFKEHFHNPKHQENIRNSKEEQYQEGFLTDLFVETLGYTKNPKTNFNLTTEYKNIKDAKKVDGAIIINEKVKGVIELKGTDTTDLGKVEEQAFGYKNNQPECVYVIISNFEKLRFYIDNAIEHIEFNLFTLTQSEFELLYLCLAFENIVKDLPRQIKNESLSSEDVITKKLYADYSAFRRVLFQNIVQQNPQFDKLVLFKKTQKLLDRFLFIFFAEDRQLLPPNSIRTILDQWKQLKELDSYKPLWERFKLYFHYMNVGRKGTQYDIFPYNGGLFLPDLMLDNITIDDDILFEHTLKLSNYDFDTEVDVDILGHIFEHSLNEIEEIQSELEGKELDKSKTKRKKDGIFYTPKYITKYIVDNTVGKLCTEKKAELQINEADYISDKKIQKQTKQALADKLTQYRNWLLQIKICDPACGSGAFLNQALDFLIKEHRYIDELQAKLFGASLILSDIENSILENNLFGVDLNEESVEIARLSLWLRTARPNRKLNDLSNNIKCGNSLIDDPTVAGSKAFNWFLEFPQVFPHYRKPKAEITKEEPEPGDKDYTDEVQEPSYSYKPGSKGFEKYGFDVVIGNPPYGVDFNEVEKRYLTEFDKLVPDFEIYIYFISLYKKILKSGSILSYIFPNTFLSIMYGKKYRDEIFQNVSVSQIVDLSNDNTFIEASVRTCIFSLINFNSEYTTEFLKIENKEFIKLKSYNKEDILNETENILGLFSQNKEEISIIKKLQNQKSLKNYHEVSQGLIPYDKYRGHDEYTIKNRIWHSDHKKDETYKKELKGGDVNRYNIEWNGSLWISYGKWLAAPRDIKFFISKRILIREITADTLFCGYTEDEYYNTPSSINIIDEQGILNLKYSLVLLNSKLIGWLHNKTSPKANKGLFPKILINDVRNIPLVEVSNELQLPFIEKADLMLTLNKQFQELSQKFQRNMQREFNLVDLPTKLQNWYQLTYPDFIKELDKKKVKLSLSQKAEWEEYFNAESKKAKELKDQIDRTDEEIDNMVYQLYGLTPEEIEIVKSNQ